VFDARLSRFDVLKELLIGVQSKSIQADGSDRLGEVLELGEPLGKGNLEQRLGGETPHFVQQAKFAFQKRNFRKDEVRESDG
jgi:hypothetical protein